MEIESTAPVGYVVAVSGGVDSVALLHILALRLPAQRLVVAHYDHGVRDDSAQDRLLVERLARAHGLVFAAEEGRLGAHVSEAEARHKRYDFLRRVKQAHGAQYIVTAHHEDDLLETAIINLLRGTGRKGLSALRSHGDLYRPLLNTPKAHIKTYAQRHGLQWREDSTNADPRYLRNHVRQTIMPRLDERARRELRHLIDSTRSLNSDIDELVGGQLQSNLQENKLDRGWFRVLPDDVANEVMAAWLRSLEGVVIDRKMVERAVEAARTLNPGKQTDVNKRWVMVVSKEELRIVPRHPAA